MQTVELYLPALYFLDEKLHFKNNYENTINALTDSAEVLETTQNLSNAQEQMVNSHKTELENFDISTILQLDKKVSEQQLTLEKAGVAGFFETKNPVEIKVQMLLIDFICQLEKKESSEELGYASTILTKGSNNATYGAYKYRSGSDSSHTWW